MKIRSCNAFSLMEMLAVITILGMLAALIVPRVSGVSDESKRQSCFVLKGDIEVQVQRWWRENGGAPASNLADIYADIDYFPEGVYTCPVDGSAYTIDTTTGEVVGHTH